MWLLWSHLALAEGTNLLHRDPVGFGLGAVVGLPTGLTVAYWKAGSKLGYDADIAWRADNGGGFLFQASALYRFADLQNEEWEEIHFPVYVGVGPRFLANQASGVYNNGQQNYLGLRVPVGMSVYHSEVPVEGFLELSPVLKLFPEIGFAFDLVVGGRFYFGPG